MASPGSGIDTPPPVELPLPSLLESTPLVPVEPLDSPAVDDSAPDDSPVCEPALVPLSPTVSLPAVVVGPLVCEPVVLAPVSPPPSSPHAGAHAIPTTTNARPTRFIATSAGYSIAAGAVVREPSR
jgi:hypothetical protein